MNNLPRTNPSSPFPQRRETRVFLAAKEALDFRLRGNNADADRHSDSLLTFFTGTQACAVT